MNSNLQKLNCKNLTLYQRFLYYKLFREKKGSAKFCWILRLVFNNIAIIIYSLFWLKFSHKDAWKKATTLNICKNKNYLLLQILFLLYWRPRWQLQCFTCFSVETFADLICAHKTRNYVFLLFVSPNLRSPIKVSVFETFWILSCWIMYLTLWFFQTVKLQKK